MRKNDRASSAGASPLITSGIRSSDLPDWFFNMIAPSAVQLAVVPCGAELNSIWDLALSPKGRLFLSACGEGLDSAAAQVYEFLPRSQSFRFCLDTCKECLTPPRCIPPSKIHSSMGFTDDGRLIMATHTTAPAPSHPAWMLEHYFSHPWEGYPGSNILTYDLKTGDVHNLGVPVPRDSIYGGVFDSKYQALYFISFLRGHLHRFDLKTREVQDLGQVTEFGSFRLIIGPDHHVYGSSRSGSLFRVNVDQRKVEDLGVSFADNPNEWNARQKNLHHACVGPDQRIYMTAVYTDELYAYDVKKRRLETVGRFEPEPRIRAVYPRSVMGLQFDADGCLWYCQRTQNRLGDGIWPHLTKWDLLRGQSPKIIGLFGTPKRTALFVSEIVIQGHTLYAADTNHGADAPALVTVDLKAVDKTDKSSPCVSRDPSTYMFLEDAAKVYPGSKYQRDVLPYRQVTEHYQKTAAFMAPNTVAIQAEHIDVIRLWHEIPPEESAVRRLLWKKNGDLQGICGSESVGWQFVIKGGHLHTLAKLPSNRSVQCLKDSQVSDCRPPRILRDIPLPATPGRQYLSVPSAWVEWTDGSWLVGTQDGWLAQVHPGRPPRSLGQAALQGTVRQIVTNGTRTRAYGLAGDESDLDLLFAYDLSSGLRRLGRMIHSLPATPYVVGSYQPRTLALSPDGQTLAIGVIDRLGCVYLYTNLKRG